MSTPATRKRGAKDAEEETPTEDVTTEDPDATAEGEEEAPKKKGRVKKEPPPPKQREVKASMADEKITRVIEVVKNAEEPVTYQEIMEEANVLYDVCQFSLTALALVGMVEKVGTWEGQSRSRIAWQWIGEK